MRYRRTRASASDAFSEPREDPLDGLVNLFDVGIVLAVAFLIAGLGLSIDQRNRRLVPRDTTPAKVKTQTMPTTKTVPAPTERVRIPADAKPTQTRVYRLPDGSLVLAEKP